MFACNLSPSDDQPNISSDISNSDEFETVHKIEAERNGANLRVALTIRLLLALHAKEGVTFHAGSVSNLIFTIPRSQWVDELLPNLRYGGLEVLEIRYGSGVAIQGLRNAVAEIKEAQKSLGEGQWDHSALHCRKAIEGILTAKSPTASLPITRFDQKVNALITDNLPGIDDAEARLLFDQMNFIWQMTSPSAHGTPQHLFKRPDEPRWHARAAPNHGQ